MITQQGLLNTTALVVPGLYVQIVPPQSLIINGVPTDTAGIVGTASWGPVNTAVIVGSMSEFASAFGPIMPRKYDLGTDVAIAVLQGAANFRCVRVTDGTDTKATLTVEGIILSALYTGTLGNSLSVTFAAGSAANTWRVTIGMPGATPETYNNIAGTGAAFWTNLAKAINSGNSAIRGPSALVSAATNAVVTPPAVGTSLFSTTPTGTDGVATMTDAVVIGSDDLTPRTGMYALRNQGCALAMLAGVDAFANGSVMGAFGLSETVYMIGSGPSGDTITNAVTTKAEAGIDCYDMKLMFGDFAYWSDTVNQVQRLVSPSAFVLGRLANLSPNQSSLNKPIFGILGTQKSGLPGSGAANVYSDADLTVLIDAGIDVIGNPAPGGAYWATLSGHNTSSDEEINGDYYTRMTNYIASTLNSAMGIFVGENVTPELYADVSSALTGFCANLLGQGLLSKTQIANTNGSITLQLPYQVVCNATNNPDSRTSLGYVQADVQVKYQAINEKFIVNTQGGVSVQIGSQS